jgi:hypothetical protein
MSLTAEKSSVRAKTRVLGGITVIDTPLITRAMDYATSRRGDRKMAGASTTR